MDFKPTRLLCPWNSPKILEWVAIPFSKGCSKPRDRTWFPCISGRLFIVLSHQDSPQMNFPGSTVTKNLPANAGDSRHSGSIPESGRSLGGRNGNPFQYSCLKNSMERGAWQESTVHGVTEGQTRLKQLHFHYSLSCIGEGNGNPLQCSCLENPRDGEAWWAAVYGVAQSQTQLKWLSISK